MHASLLLLQHFFKKMKCHWKTGFWWLWHVFAMVPWFYHGFTVAISCHVASVAILHGFTWLLQLGFTVVLCFSLHNPPRPFANPKPSCRRSHPFVHPAPGKEKNVLKPMVSRWFWIVSRWFWMVSRWFPDGFSMFSRWFSMVLDRFFRLFWMWFLGGFGWFLDGFGCFLDGFSMVVSRWFWMVVW